MVEGAPADRLLEAVDRDGAELLVVGSRGRRALRAAMLGSVSRRLATSASCPVVVVPPDAAADQRGAPADASVVCGVDDSDHATAAARLGADLARRMGLRLLLVNAVAGFGSYLSYAGARSSSPSPSAQPDEARRVAQQTVDAAVDAVGGDAAGIVGFGLPWDVLESIAQREHGQLLLVAARGLSPARAAFLGSVADRLATTGHRPLVILPEAAERSWGSRG